MYQIQSVANQSWTELCLATILDSGHYIPDLK